jgi:hypothetical protein
MTFIKPIKYGHLTNETSKKHIYTPDNVDSVLAPYEGVITDVNYSKCDGLIQISHLLNGKVFYSEICGVNKNIYVGSGMSVKKGDIIGQCGGKDIKFVIKDSNKNEIDLQPFFVGKFETDKKDLDKKDSDKEKKEKGLGEPSSNNEKNKENKKSEKNKEDDEDENKPWDFTNYNPGMTLPNLFTAAALTPFDFIEKALKPKRKEKKEEIEDLQEELKRIKKLLK